MHVSKPPHGSRECNLTASRNHVTLTRQSGNQIRPGRRSGAPGRSKRKQADQWRCIESDGTRAPRPPREATRRRGRRMGSPSPKKRPQKKKRPPPPPQKKKKNGPPKKKTPPPPPPARQRNSPAPAVTAARLGAHRARSRRCPRLRGLPDAGGIYLTSRIPSASAPRVGRFATTGSPARRGVSGQRRVTVYFACLSGELSRVVSCHRGGLHRLTASTFDPGPDHPAVPHLRCVRLHRLVLMLDTQLGIVNIGIKALCGTRAVS